MTTAPDPIQITLDNLGDITPEDWQRISIVAGHVAQHVVNESLRGVADAIARGVHESVLAQFDLATATVIRDENGVITGASTITKRVA